MAGFTSGTMCHPLDQAQLAPLAQLMPAPNQPTTITRRSLLVTSIFPCSLSGDPADNLFKSFPLSRLLKSSMKLSGKALCELAVKGSTLNNWSLIVSC